MTIASLIKNEGRKKAQGKNKMRGARGDARGIFRTILEQVSTRTQKRGEKGWMEKRYERGKGDRERKVEKRSLKIEGKAGSNKENEWCCQ